MADSRGILILNVDTNKGEEENGSARSSSLPSGVDIDIDISQNLQKSILRMTGKFLKEESGTVDYKALRDSEEFRCYCSLATRLGNVDLSSMDETQRVAFFINVYNALTIHSICEIQKTSDIATILDVPNFWGSYAYQLGRDVFTLDDVEHGVLRGNRPHPSTGTTFLKSEDPRTRYSLQKVDPRIHFALNCGAKACPMIRVYNCSNLEVALEGATRSYLSQEVHVGKDDDIPKLKIPQILQWYMKDFADTQRGMLKWIEPYVEESVKHTINSILAAEGEDRSSVDYFYNWSLNKA